MKCAGDCAESQDYCANHCQSVDGYLSPEAFFQSVAVEPQCSFKAPWCSMKAEADAQSTSRHLKTKVTAAHLMTTTTSATAGDKDGLHVRSNHATLLPQAQY